MSRALLIHIHIHLEHQSLAIQGEEVAMKTSLKSKNQRNMFLLSMLKDVQKLDHLFRKRTISEAL